MPPFSFKILKEDHKARVGEVTTAHGTIRTPAFMPVGTLANVKAMLPQSVKKTGADIILCNTYHLMLRPTAELIDEHFDGLRNFMNWHGPILTDSGGFQVMSLSKLRKITEEGVRFSSHIDGSKHLLTPERSIEIQHLLDSDISMIFDDCPAFPITEKKAKNSMYLSLRWAERSKKAYKEREGYGLFAIVQGSTFENLRKISAKELVDMDFPGYAIGGLAVGEGHELMVETLSYTVPMLPKEKPHYLMGVGKPKDIVAAVKEGIDMFDCVIPTRSGRNGQVFSREGIFNIRKKQYSTDPRPIDPLCKCEACTNYSRSYLNHLFRSGEILGAMLLTWHNIQYYQDLMSDIRSAISEGKLSELCDQFGV